MRLLIIPFCLGAFFAAALPASGDTAFQNWLEDQVWPLARQQAVARSTFDLALGDVTPDQDLPGLQLGQGTRLQHQAEFRAPGTYFASSSLAQLTRAGRAVSSENARFLARLETSSGVPGRIVTAIWGRESRFGRAKIDHDVFRVLSTRAYFGPRAAFYRRELLAALLILQRGDTGRDTMKSNWAGAMGQPQFLPSSLLRYGSDGDSNGKVDIWTSEKDSLASIASYLKQNGWVPGRDWGFEVSVPDSIACALEGPDHGRTIDQWTRLGIERVSGRPFPAKEVNQIGYLLMPAGRRGPAFIVTPNFYVLKRYNESDLYALFVGHLADRIAFGLGDFRRDWDPIKGLGRAQILALQKRLVSLGYDVGGVDGLVGYKTRRSIGLWQQGQNSAQTCFPDARLARQLR
jgi:lytic murein transglycosylase